MTTPVALIVIYNHRFDRNIEIVERIYRDRFSSIYHLVPFYDGPKDNVIAVYEASHCFQGYVAQGYRVFKGDYRHYFFVADDMILNPAIDERTYADHFALDADTSFIPELDPMPEGRWPHDRAAVNYDPYRVGVEIRNEIPDATSAAEALRRHGVTNGPYGFRTTYFWNRDYSARNVVTQLIRYLYDRVVLKTRLASSRYPFARSYSDLFVVAGTRMERFVHYCGAFAATDLWVELAVPTALVLAGGKIRVESEMALRGRPLWTQDDYKVLEAFGYRLKDLLARFPKDYIYLHPVKLSKWDVTE